MKLMKKKMNEGINEKNPNNFISSNKLNLETLSFCIAAGALTNAIAFLKT